MHPENIIIIGGGVAGFAMAIACEALGHHVTVIECDDHLTRQGGIQLAPNGWRAAATLGIAERLETVALPLHLMRLVSLASRHTLVNLPLEATQQRQPYTSIRQADFLKVLSDSAEAAKNISRLDAEVKQVATEHDKVLLTLADNSVLTADWVIGADGAGGLCRCYVAAGENPTLFPRRVAYRFVTDLKALTPVMAARASCVWLGDGGHLVHYPLLNNTLNVVAVVRYGEGSWQRAEKLLTLHPYLDQKALGEAAEIPLAQQRRLDTRQRGRVLLTGDAACVMPPHLAQGTGQALIDAASLLTLARAHDSFERLAPLWAGLRMRACREAGESANAAGRLFAAATPLTRWRDLALSYGGEMVLGRILDRLWGDHEKTPDTFSGPGV